MGWMQFIPDERSAEYGVDANRDGRKDPYNPVDAIFAAARYLRAAGADRDVRTAVFAYNHADWYVDAVLRRAQRTAPCRAISSARSPALAQGRFPIRGGATDSKRDGRARHRARRACRRGGDRGRRRPDHGHRALGGARVARRAE